MHSEARVFDPLEVAFAAVVVCIAFQLEQVRNLAVVWHLAAVANDLGAHFLAVNCPVVCHSAAGKTAPAMTDFVDFAMTADNSQKF